MRVEKMLFRALVLGIYYCFGSLYALICFSAEKRRTSGCEKRE